MSTATAEVKVTKERPILFSGPMVRAILDGKKTQTRRVIADAPEAAIRLRYEKGYLESYMDLTDEWLPVVGRHGCETMVRCPYGEAGDRLWVRETHGIFSVDTGSVSVGFKERLPDGKTLADTDGGLDVISVTPEQHKWAEDHIDNERWRPSIFMPRWASRLTLQITAIRVERLREITPKDCVAEGMTLRRWAQEDSGNGMPWLDVGIEAEGRELLNTFQRGWNKINGKRKGCDWNSNPWCWAITFKKL